MKEKTFYLCSECGYRSAKYYGKCPSCNEWGTLEEQAPVAKKTTGATLFSRDGEPAGAVLYKDLEKDSPYNTYKYGGLPAGAICSPGIESLEAAMNPEKHNYLFYHTDTEKNDGSHIFTETFSQHKNS